MALVSGGIPPVGGESDHWLTSQRGEKPFQSLCPQAKLSKVLMDPAWVLYSHLDKSLGPNGVPAWVTCPSLRPVGEDTVVDSPSEHRNEGEVAPPKEGVSAAKTNCSEHK